jgi:hypothetical protein
MRVHAAAVTAPVHHDVRHAEPGDGPVHQRIGQSAADVVDDAGAGAHRCSRRVGSHGVDADRHARGGEGLDDGDDARQLLVRWHALRSGAGGLAAHVDEVGSLRVHLEAVGHRPVTVEEEPAVGEGVGGDVEDAHDERAIQAREAGRQPLGPPH